MVDAAIDASQTDGQSGNESEGDGGERADAAQHTDGGPQDDGIPDGTNIVKMVAPSVCKKVLDGLGECKLDPTELQAPTVPATGQFKTRVSGHKKGNCETQYPFVARLSADGIAPIKFVLFVNDEIFLRRDDSAALTSVDVEDASAFAGAPIYDLSCRVWLEFDFNLPI